MDELDSYRAAKILLDQHGAQEAWRILMARAIEEHTARKETERAITQQVLTALRALTREPEIGGRLQ